MSWTQVKPPPQVGVSGDELIGIGVNGTMTFHSKFVRKNDLRYAKWINLYVDNPAEPLRIAFDFPDRPNESSYPFRMITQRSVYYRAVCLKAFLTNYELHDIRGLHFRPIKEEGKFVIDLANPVDTPRKVAIMRANSRR